MDAKVWDLETERLVSPGTALKLLLERSGMGRNLWHEKAESKAKRTFGSPSKLSDVFADRRALPLRDLVPLLDVLNLNEEIKEHYICEFFRAYTDISLRKYISESKDESVIRSLKKRQSQLENELQVALSSTLEHNYMYAPINNKKHQAMIELYRKEVRSRGRIIKEICQKSSDFEHFTMGQEMGYFDAEFDVEIQSIEADYWREVEEKKDSFEFTLEQYEVTKQLLESVVYEISESHAVSEGSQHLLAHLLDDDFIPAVRQFGKYTNSPNVGDWSWLKFVPRPQNLNSVALGGFAIWARHNLDKCRLIVDGYYYARNGIGRFNADMFLYKAFEVTLKPHFRKLIDNFVKEYPKTCELFSLVSPSFLAFIKHQYRLKDIFEFYLDTKRNLNSDIDTLALIEQSQTEIDRNFTDKLTDAYLKYVYTGEGDSSVTLWSLRSRAEQDRPSPIQRYRLKTRRLRSFDEKKAIASRLIIEITEKAFKTQEIERRVVNISKDLSEEEPKLANILASLGCDSKRLEKEFIERILS